MPVNIRLMTGGKIKRAHRFETITHYLTAFVVFMKGLDKVAMPGKMLYGITFLMIAALIIFGTVFHHRFERHLKHFKGFVFVFEAIVMGVVGYLYLKEGKQYIQYVCFLTAVAYSVVATVYFWKAKTAASNNL